MVFNIEIPDKMLCCDDWQAICPALVVFDELGTHQADGAGGIRVDSNHAIAPPEFPVEPLAVGQSAGPIVVIRVLQQRFGAEALAQARPHLLAAGGDGLGENLLDGADQAMGPDRSDVGGLAPG